MSMRNPFESYQIAIPSKYSDKVKQFCKQSSSQTSPKYTPFNRQVDFWYFAFLYATKEDLPPDHLTDTSNITAASILDDYHINHIQMTYLAKNLDIESLVDSRKIFNDAADMANAGIPHVIQLLSDDEDTPLDNLFFYLEQNMK